MERMNFDIRSHITLYQSNYFRDFFPKDNDKFERLEIVPETETRDSSILKLREVMIVQDFSAGVFIGGMEGVLDEFNMFRKANPTALLLPMASTGGAAKIIYEKEKATFNNRLLTEYAYMALFRDLLGEFI